LSRVEHTWTTLGDRDPYWSVLTDDAFKLGNVEKNEDLFWGSGKHDVLRMCRWMQRNGIHRPGARCLEYGCGMGRMSGWLVQEFGSLIACDISEAHLRLARRAASLRGDRGIQFLRISKLTDLDELPPFDILFSIIVLQHNPPPVIAYLIDRLLHRLEPGGIAYFQVPTFQAGYRFSVEEYLAPDSGCGQSMEMHALPQRNVFQIAARNGCEAIEVSPDNMTGSLDFVSTTFLLRKR
jgi:SAM-dependent methyltransferase